MATSTDRGFVKRQVPASLAVLSGPRPPDALCFQSDHLQVLCNSSDTSWVDPAPHFHETSDEAYLVLEGSIVLTIAGETVRVDAGEVCFVQARIVHSVIQVEAPYRGFVIRAPATDDKVYVQPAGPGGG